MIFPKMIFLEYTISQSLYFLENINFETVLPNVFRKSIIPRKKQISYTYNPPFHFSDFDSFSSLVDVKETLKKIYKLYRS